jgi:hypothetical protein
MGLPLRPTSPTHTHTCHLLRLDCPPCNLGCATCMAVPPFFPHSGRMKRGTNQSCLQPRPHPSCLGSSMQIWLCSASERRQGAPPFGGTAGRWAPLPEQPPKPRLRSPCLPGSIQGAPDPTFCHGRMPRLSRRGGRRPSTLGRAGELEDEVPPKVQAAAAEAGASEAAMHDLVHEAPLLTVTLLHAVASAAAGLAWTVAHGTVGDAARCSSSCACHTWHPACLYRSCLCIHKPAVPAAGKC